jgi:glucose-6-phosphate dehydrogenase assembly protein OpcA
VKVLSGGAPFAADVRDLGRELQRLWESTVSGDDTKVVRSCTRNLVLIVPDEAVANAARGVIAGVAERHPARAFLVAAAPPDEPQRLQAVLEAHCQMRGGGKHVCCESIALEVGSAARRRAASAIVPLLVPDLPVLVFAGRGLDWNDELLARLLDVADRLVIDSRRVADPARLMADLAAHRRTDRWGPADLEWLRLAPWREAVASALDDPEAAAVAAEADTLEIGYRARVAGPGGEAGAALLAGWILDRLDAARERSATGLAARAADGDGAGEEGPLSLRLVAGATARARGEDDAGPALGPAPGDVLGLRLAARRHPAALVVGRHVGRGGLSAALEDADCATPRRLHGRVPLPAEDLERWIGMQLDDVGADPLYERALARAATLLAGTAPDGGPGA